eukprot:1404627-Prymnesium_polylepis.1
MRVRRNERVNHREDVCFGRDDLLLMQRFAVQCGISLRDAGGTQGAADSLVRPKPWIHHPNPAPQLDPYSAS